MAIVQAATARHVLGDPLAFTGRRILRRKSTKEPQRDIVQWLAVSTKNLTSYKKIVFLLAIKNAASRAMTNSAGLSAEQNEQQFSDSSIRSYFIGPQRLKRHQGFSAMR
jgi:hypothetical protein